MEDRITFSSGTGTLEGRLKKIRATDGAVITHPHPLYGGTMDNDVVIAMTKAYQKLGYTTLRFNFRGVGESQGIYGDGVGEQEDVRAAVSYLADSGINRIDLAGYSFGAWVNALTAMNHLNIVHLVMVSPPVTLIDFGSVSNLSRLDLIITGSRDDIAPAEMIQKAHPGWNSATHFEVIEGADHFYGRYLDELETVLRAHLENRK
jgi:alpha/beta superfamily hydrolase